MMNKIEFGDCREIMQRWAAEGIKVQTCVTSPPYFGLRDYGHENQIGLEQTPDEYVSSIVDVFRCVRDVLADDGTLWLNLGDSYAAQRSGTHMPAQTVAGGKSGKGDERAFRGMGGESRSSSHRNASAIGLKHKDLIGIPWRIAFALQADGWYLRQDIIWHKPNPMPESVRDRCTKAHEYIFLLSKSERYYFDSAAMREPANTEPASRNKAAEGYQADYPKGDRFSAGERVWGADGKRNRRSVWTVATKPYKGAHFATFPPALIEPCILAGSKPGDVVLDPFMGSGTTAAVAMQHMRKYLGCELNSTYKELQDERLYVNGVKSLFVS
jgi:DNA modification methylase